MMHSFSVSSLNRLAVAVCATFVLAAPAVYAQQTDPTPATQAATSSADTRQQSPELNLQASAFVMVPQDTVHITLSAELNADTQAKATAQLSTVLDEAVKRTEGAKGIQVQTSGYNVWPNTNEKGKILNWRARGEITLQSKDFAAASALATKLSDKVAISQISFSLSRESLEQAETALLKQAADAFATRAQAAATAFGYKNYRVQQLDLSGGGPEMSSPRPMRAMMAKSSVSDYADAPLEAGTVPVTLSVNGKVVLH